MLSVLIDYLPLRLIQGKPSKREDRPDHVLTYLLSIFFTLCSNLAMYIESFCRIILLTFFDFTYWMKFFYFFSYIFDYSQVNF